MTRYWENMMHHRRMEASTFLLLAVMMSTAIGNARASADTPTRGDADTQAMLARSRQKDDVVKKLQVHVLSQCGLASASATYPAIQLDVNTGAVTKETTRFEVTAWSGECASGFRSGGGKIETRETTDTGPGSLRETVVVKAEGRYIVGKPQGLWCITEHPYLQNGQSVNLTLDVGCRLLANDKASDIFRRLNDGRWQQIDGSGHVTAPPLVLAAGVLERESIRIGREALSGNADILLPVFNVQSEALDGLIAGLHIRSSSGNQEVSLKGKRVALILSSRTIAEMERFTRERQARLDASVAIMASPATTQVSPGLATMFGPDLNAVEQRQRFLAASSVDTLLLRVADALRRVAREVVAVDDLTGLSQGQFDYAFVLDWQSLTRLDLLGKYQTVPTFKDYDSADASTVVGQKLGGFLITPQLESVRTYAGVADVGSKVGDCEQSKKMKTNSCDRDYFKVLADFYEPAWVSHDGFSALNFWFQ